MTFIEIYPLIKLGLKLISSTGKCVKARKAAGEDVNWLDYLECAVEGLNPLESDLIGAIVDLQDKKRKK